MKKYRNVVLYRWVRQRSSYHCCYWWCCCFGGQNQILLNWFCNTWGSQVDITDLLVCENNRRCHVLSFYACMCISEVTSCMCTAEKKSQRFGVIIDVRLLKIPRVDSEWCSVENCRLGCEWCLDEICRVEPVTDWEKPDFCWTQDAPMCASWTFNR